MRGHAEILSVVVLSFAIAGNQARAQGAPSDTASSTRRNWLIGASIGVPGYEKEALPELFTVGMNITQIKPGRLGADFSVGTMPRAFTAGAGVLGVRAGGVFPVALAPDLLLLPSAGLSLLGGAGDGGVAGLAGVNAGVAAVLWTGPIGVRTGITWHHFHDAGGAVWLIELGFVRAN